MNEYIYREWVPTGLLNRFLVFVFSAIVVFGTLFMVLFVDLPVEDSYGFIIAWGVLVFVLFVFGNYRGLEIKINNIHLSIKYRIFNKKIIEIKEIVSCHTTDASFGRYGGSGVRFGSDGSTAYTTSFGNVVEIVPVKGRIFVFSSKNPEKICEIINANI